MKYEVGDILYLLSKKNHQIVPSRVDSITTIKSVGGEEVTHELSVPGVDRTTVLEKLQVIPFSSILSLREHMVQLLEQKIDAEISAVVTAAQETWGVKDVGIEEIDHSKKK